MRPMPRLKYLDLLQYPLTSLLQFFDKGKFPARTCIGVAALPLGADVEIECVADVVEN
jgi:hypothetical protein